MTIGKYILRSVKYLTKLLLLFAALFAFMNWSETSNLTHEEGLGAFFESYFSGYRGWLFTAVVVVWSAIYPKVEFVTRRLNYDMRAHKHAIIKALNMGNMMLASDTDDSASGGGARGANSGKGERMVFRGESAVRKIWWLGEDTVTITRNPSGGFDIEGPRRFVMEAQQRIPAYIDQES